MCPSIDWNDANVARLRALWDEGHAPPRSAAAWA